MRDINHLINIVTCFFVCFLVPISPSKVQVNILYLRSSTRKDRNRERTNNRSTKFIADRQAVSFPGCFTLLCHVILFEIDFLPSSFPFQHTYMRACSVICMQSLNSPYLQTDRKIDSEVREFREMGKGRLESLAKSRDLSRHGPNLAREVLKRWKIRRHSLSLAYSTFDPR
jgi:hypothetical protein